MFFRLFFFFILLLPEVCRSINYIPDEKQLVVPPEIREVDQNMHSFLKRNEVERTESDKDFIKKFAG